ncbi:MAG: hypothetical protein Q9201_006854 [Fulgogasparrea decipioides]
MFTDAAGQPHSLAIRPAQDAYRSMPGTPLGVDPRGANTMDLAAAMNHARMGLADGGDYFLGAPKFPPRAMRPRSPMPPLSGNDWHHDGDYANRGPSNMIPLGYQERDRDREMEDQIRKDNRVAALLNGAILAPAKYAQVYPLRCDDGSFPTDFKSAKTVEAMKVLDNSQLDRIMQAYRLPLDLRSINSNGHHARDATSSSRVRQAKLLNLWEFLGAYHLLEYENMMKKLKY